MTGAPVRRSDVDSALRLGKIEWRAQGSAHIRPDSRDCDYKKTAGLQPIQAHPNECVSSYGDRPEASLPAWRVTPVLSLENASGPAG
jgi:hypothetical protein